MKAHELALKLLNGPNLDVMIEEDWGGLSDVNCCITSEITQGQAEDCGNCECRWGESIIKLILS
jgi:hypothetical protein